MTQRVLLTGMTDTGKSTVIAELARRGYAAVDTDAGDWHEWVETADGPDWIWREERIQELLDNATGEALFVAGCVSNQGRFYSQFDHIVLLSAPQGVMLHRITTRTTNPYGKRASEREEILHNLRMVEPLLRRGASLEIRTDIPLDEVVATILRLALPA